MPTTLRFAALAIILLSIPVDPLGAQAPLRPVLSISRLDVDEQLSPLPMVGRAGFDYDPQSNALTEPPESAEPVPIILSAMATGIFFGALLGGIYGDSQDDCNKCDFWGAVSGGFLGGLVGLAAGITVSIR